MNLMFPARTWTPNLRSLPDENGVIEIWDKAKWSSHEPDYAEDVIREHMIRRWGIIRRRQMGWKRRKQIRFRAEP